MNSAENFIVRLIVKEAINNSISFFFFGVCRGIPERVYPFSDGICRNLYKLCCVKASVYNLERLPTAQEIEEKSRPYTCLDFLTCRCCC